jgi:hypothetical protein
MVVVTLQRDIVPLSEDFHLQTAICEWPQYLHDMSLRQQLVYVNSFPIEGKPGKSSAHVQYKPTFRSQNKYLSAGTAASRPPITVAAQFNHRILISRGVGFSAYRDIGMVLEHTDEGYVTKWQRLLCRLDFPKGLLDLSNVHEDEIFGTDEVIVETPGHPASDSLNRRITSVFCILPMSMKAYDGNKYLLGHVERKCVWGEGAKVPGPTFHTFQNLHGLNGDEILDIVRYLSDGFDKYGAGIVRNGIIFHFQSWIQDLGTDDSTRQGGKQGR